MSAPILLSTVGSLGDLLPVLALARALEENDQTVRLLVGPSDAAIARDHGLTAIAIGPTELELTEMLGMTRSEIAASVFRDPSTILRRATYPLLAGTVREIVPHAEGARAVFHTALAMAAPLAAELCRRPHVPLLLQPTMLQSSLDPPMVTGLSPPMVASPRSSMGVAWNQAWLKVVAFEMRRRHGRAQNDVRRTIGLPPTRATPLFGHATPPLLRIGLWDPVVAPPPDDANGIMVTGFARFDLRQDLPPGLLHFLRSGPPPIVVTLGSVAHGLGGPGFWSDAIALARGAGLRVVLLSGDRQVPTGSDIHALPFAPHAKLFPYARAILHHGGMGTLGQALASGKPQLILPLGADQPDNAHRAERLGVARRIGRNIAGDQTVRALRAVLHHDVTRRAEEVAANLIPDGASVAARAILAALSSHDIPASDTVRSD